MTTDPAPAQDLIHLLRPGADGRVDVVEYARALQAYARETQRPADLVVAGQLARLAWETLRAESDALLERATDAPGAATAPADDPWDAFLASEWALDVQGRDRVAEALLDAQEPFLRPALRRPASPPLPRRVTLAELLDVLQDAQRDAEAHVAAARDAAARRARARDRRDAAPAAVLDDDPAAELQRIRSALSAAGGRATLRELAAARTADALVAAMMAVLELARRGEVRVEQEAFPVGRVWVAARAGCG